MKTWAVAVLWLLTAMAMAVTTGCSVVAAVADSKQVPPISAFTSKKTTDQVFTAAAQAMGAFGKVVSSDRTSGTVQGQKGSWTLSAGITSANGVSRVEVSARFVPAKQMDFYSRDGLTAEYVALMEKSLGEKLAPVGQ